MKAFISDILYYLMTVYKICRSDFMNWQVHIIIIIIEANVLFSQEYATLDDFGDTV